MSSLPNAVYTAADRLGVVVYQANRSTVEKWNTSPKGRSIRHFCGFYWYLRSRGGNAETTQRGPFSSESAAYADAITELEKSASSDARVASVLRRNALMAPAREGRHANA